MTTFNKVTEETFHSFLAIREFFFFHQVFIDKQTSAFKKLFISYQLHDSYFLERSHDFCAPDVKDPSSYFIFAAIRISAALNAKLSN